MAKELPYFQFEPAEYLTKDISFCTLSAQGLFINICAYYWQRNCELKKSQFIKRFRNNEAEFNELINEGVIDLNDDDICIKFLDRQRDEAISKSQKNSINGSKGGRPKKPKQNPNESEIKPKQNPTESQTKGIRKDNIRKEEIKEDNKIEELKTELQKYTSSYPQQMLDEFFNYWSGKDKPTSRKTRIESQPTFDYEKRLATWFRNKNDFKIEYLAKRLLEDDKYKSNFLSLYPSLDYKNKITEFYNQRLSTGKLEDSFKGFCEHFFSWVRASIQK
jgi:hypothetical protein